MGVREWPISRSADSALLGVGVRFLLLGATLFLVTSLVTSNPVGSASLLLIVCAIACVAAARRDWRQPWCIGLLVFFVVNLLVPWLITIGRPIGLVTPDSIATETLNVGSVSVAGFLSGLLVRSKFRNAPVVRASPTSSRAVGLTLAWLATLTLIPSLITRSRTVYGANQVLYHPLTGLSTISISLVLASVFHADLKPKRRDGALLALPLLLWCGANLVIGARAPVLCLVLLIVLKWSRPKLRFSQALVSILGFVAFSGMLVAVSAWRGGEQTTFRGALSIENALADVSSPTYINNIIIRRYPESIGSAKGETYVTAIARQAPRVITEPILGAPSGSGAFRFRSLIDLTNPNVGLGFGFTSEALLNFAMSGVFAVSLLFAVALGELDRRATHRAVWSPAYFVIVATLPYGLRSDALAHLKLAWLPVVVFAITRSVSLSTIRRSVVGSVARTRTRST